MIIECISCGKKFSVNSDLIPSEGRTIQCGSCNHVWFYDNKNNISQKKEILEKPKRPIKSKNIKKIDSKINKIKSNYSSKSSEIVRYEPKTNFSFSKFLSYIVVIIISFVALIILLDTLKTPLYEIFPNLEFLLFSLYETLKDIELFIKDLI